MAPSLDLFLGSFSRPLLVAHAIAAVVLAASLTQLAWLSLKRLTRGSAMGPLAAYWAHAAGASYLLSFALGLLLYPSYRYLVRGLYLDRYEPWASNLFDIKENLFGIGLPVALALVFLGRSLREGDKQVEQVVAWGAIALWLITIAASIMGLVITDVRGVG